ncbi:hypothetical protein EW026_g4448 [Hermanssonia centrifuga]|uniref:Uncharacterized protein n=1 Tax=Hermanssonia centrifuga TaxID=98765 RepID=A0A4V3XAC2_9APHY|nr:hypothetical protein EW026_g4448 [Hermanssonia centrifuga]
MESIKFAYDWRQPDKQSGFRKAKADFYEETLSHLEEYQIYFCEVEGTDRKTLYKMNLATPYKNWRHINKPIVTGRNWLLDLYSVVIYEYEHTHGSQFGAAILIDPVWEIGNLSRHLSCNLPRLLIQIYDNIPEAYNEDTASKEATLLTLHTSSVESKGLEP